MPVKFKSFFIWGGIFAGLGVLAFIVTGLFSLSPLVSCCIFLPVIISGLVALNKWMSAVKPDINFSECDNNIDDLSSDTKNLSDDNKEDTFLRTHQKTNI